MSTGMGAHAGAFLGAKYRWRTPSMGRRPRLLDERIGSIVFQGDDKESRRIESGGRIVILPPGHAEAWSGGR